MAKLACIIVTYNRFTKLQKALAAYAKQTVLPDFLIVVNNNSMDEATQNYLDAWGQEKLGTTKKVVLAFEDNKGSAGGLVSGCKKALALGAEWIWLAPDDAYPEADALDQAQKFLNDEKLPENVVAISGSVYEKGKLALNHRQRYQAKLWSFKHAPVPEAEYKQESFVVQLCSAVGLIIKADVLEDLGHVEPAYFIYATDLGYSYKLSQQGQIICLPELKVQHDPDEMAITETTAVDWRYYYQVRNYFYFLKTFFPVAYRLEWNQTHSKTRLKMMAGRDIQKNSVLLKALEDARLDRMGLCKTYRPR
jgi:GT2 family glycosyltransferase